MQTRADGGGFRLSRLVLARQNWVYLVLRGCPGIWWGWVTEGHLGSL